MLRFLKILHTIIWAGMTACNFVAFYFAYIGRFDGWFWIPASILALEGLVMLVTWWECPITTFARQFSVDRRPNFDIYLPEWVAKHNIAIFAVLIISEALIVLDKRLG